jgi:predicted porin
VTYGDGASKSQRYVGNNGQGTSQITFKGTEDLGGGLKASFLLENDFDTRFDANGNAFNGKSNIGSGGGEQFLGLAGSMGEVKIGAPNTPTLTAQGSRQPIGTKIGSGFGSSLGTKHVRNNNSLVFSTPVYNGFSAAYGTAFGTNADVNQAGAYNISTGDAKTVAGLNTKGVGRISDLGLNYANGPLRAGVSFYTVAQVAAVDGETISTTAATTFAGKNKQTNIYAQYTLAAATFYVGSHKESTDGAEGAAKALDASGSNVALKYALTGNVNLLANYAKLDDKLEANKDVKTTAFGAQYVFSKNTSAYVRSVKETMDNETGATKAAKTTTTLIGLQTNF